MRQEKFSIRKTNRGAVSACVAVIGLLALTGFGQEVKAEETVVTTASAVSISSETVNPVDVTTAEEELAIAEEAVSTAQESVDATVTAEGVAEEELNRVQDLVDLAKTATPEAIAEKQDQVTDLTRDLTSAEEDVQTKETDLVTAEKVEAVKIEEFNRAQAEKTKAEAEVVTAQTAVQGAHETVDQAKSTVTQATTSAKEATDKKSAAQEAVNQAKTALDEAKKQLAESDSTRLNQALTTAKEQLQDAEKALAALKSKNQVLTADIANLKQQIADAQLRLPNEEPVEVYDFWSSSKKSLGLKSPYWDNSVFTSGMLASEEERYQKALSGDNDQEQTIFSYADGSMGMTNSAADQYGVKAFNEGAFIDHHLIAEYFLDILNNERARLGRKPLALSKDEMFLADVRAEEQAAYGDLRSHGQAHTRPDGTNWSTVYKEYGAKGYGTGENILQRGVSSPSELLSEKYLAEVLFEQWKNSTGHYANMTSAYHTHIGLGVALSEIIYNGGPIHNTLLGVTLFSRADRDSGLYTPQRPSDKTVTLRQELNGKTAEQEQVQKELSDFSAMTLAQAMEKVRLAQANLDQFATDQKSVVTAEHHLSKANSDLSQAEQAVEEAQSALNFAKQSLVEKEKALVTATENLTDKQKKRDVATETLSVKQTERDDAIVQVARTKDALVTVIAHRDQLAEQLTTVREELTTLLALRDGRLTAEVVLEKAEVALNLAREERTSAQARLAEAIADRDEKQMFLDLLKERLRQLEEAKINATKKDTTPGQTGDKQITAETLSQTRNQFLALLDQSGLTDAQKGELAIRATFAETLNELAAVLARYEALTAPVETPAPAGQTKPVAKPVASTSPAPVAAAAAAPVAAPVSKPAGKTLPATGDKTSSLALLGTGLLLASLGAVFQRRHSR